MRRLGFLFAGLMSIALIAFVLSSCSEDPAPPVAKVNHQIGEDGYTVSFTATVQNVNTYLWNFGDGSATSTEAAPEYTYPKSGDYTVTLTVTGEGGTVDADPVVVNIEATVIEYLTGGPGDTDGKTWVLSRTATAGTDGVSAVHPNYAPIYLPLPNDALDLFGLGDEYDNEFTFFYDGDLAIKGINTAVLNGYVFGVMNQIEPLIDPGTAAGMYAGIFTDITDGSFTLHEDSDLTKNSCNEAYPTGVTEAPEDVTFTGINYLTFADGSHFGIKDFNTEVIIRDIDSDRMTVSIFLSSIYPDAYPDWYTKPSLLITATYEAK